MRLTGIVKAELWKMFTARSSLILCLLALGLCFGIAAISAAFSEFANGSAGRDFTDLGQLTVFFVLILGTFTIGGEFRHGSVAPTLLVTPSRTLFLAGKLIALVIVSVALCVVAVEGCVLIAEIVLPARDISLNFGGGDFIDAVLATAAVAPLWALVGFAVACIVRNQTGAIVLILVWIFVLEGIAGSIWSAYTPYALGNALGAAAGSSDVGVLDPLSQGQGFLVAGAYIAVLLAAGWAAVQKSDITG